MTFEKWHAHGNAYLVVERPPGGVDALRVRRLCDRRTGIGSDGIVEIVRVAEGEAEIAIWNPDGSIAEMSGNGVRIAARWLADRLGQHEVVVTTAGRRLHARMLGGLEAELDVGEVEVGAPEVVSVPGEAIELSTALLGNPHAVVRLDRATREDLLRVGPALELHARFPNHTNVQLVDPVGANELRVLVWERGAGETASSGSSAVAAAAVAVAREWCVSPITVHMPGGDLVVTLAGSRASLLGPAERICTGTTSL